MLYLPIVCRRYIFVFYAGIFVKKGILPQSYSYYSVNIIITCFNCQFLL